MRAPQSVVFGSVVLFATVLLRCSGSSSSNGGDGGNGGNNAGGANAIAGSATAGGGRPNDAFGGSASAHAGAAGTAHSSGAAGTSAGGMEISAAGATDPGIPLPVISDIADINIIENIMATPTSHVSFTVTDDGGVDGITATATSSNTMHAAPGAVTCTSGTCSFDVIVTPNLVASFAITVMARDPRGGTAMGAFGVAIQPRMVLNGNDAGPGSLRAAVNSALAGDVATFDAAVTKITLTSPVGLNQPIVLNGPGAAALTVDGGSGAQVFAVSADNVNIHGLTITHAQFGVAVFTGHLYLDSAVVTNNTAVGLSVSASNGNTALADVTGSTFSGNPTNGAVMQVDGANSSATGYFTSCTFTGNGNGVSAVTNAAGQTAHIGLLGNDQIHDNTAYGVVVEIDNSLGAATLEVSTPNVGTANLITKNPVGVRRSGPVASNALTITPATQVTANTTNFLPVWP